MELLGDENGRYIPIVEDISYAEGGNDTNGDNSVNCVINTGDKDGACAGDMSSLEKCVQIQESVSERSGLDYYYSYSETTVREDSGVDEGILSVQEKINDEEITWDSVSCDEVVNYQENEILESDKNNDEDKHDDCVNSEYEGAIVIRDKENSEGTVKLPNRKKTEILVITCRKDTIFDGCLQGQHNRRIKFC